METNRHNKIVTFIIGVGIGFLISVFMVVVVNTNHAVTTLRYNATMMGYEEAISMHEEIVEDMYTFEQLEWLTRALGGMSADTAEFSYSNSGIAYRRMMYTDSKFTWVVSTIDLKEFMPDR